MIKHLINAEDIKARTVVQVSVSAHKLDVYAPQAQRRYLRPLLGAVLYSELLLFVQVETPDVTDPLAVLAEQVKAMLANWAMVEAWPMLQAQITDAGVKFTDSRQNSTTADYKTLQDMLASLRDTAAFEGTELVRWLVEHKEDYPSYVPPTVAAPSGMPLGGIDFN